jgi:hypothetical protein
MKNKLSDRTRLGVAITIIASAVVMRLVPHIPNFAPMTAAALFGAAYLPKRYALLTPLIALAVSDYLLLYISPFSQPVFNFSHVHAPGAMLNDTTLWVWGSFMVSALLGLLLRHKAGALKIGAVSLAASLQFFLITNFGVWAAGAYARNLSGLGASYIAGLPFLRWTMLGDLFYTACFFGLYAYVRNPESFKLPVFRQKTLKT